MVLYYHHTPAGQKHVKPRMNPGSPAPRSQSPSAQPALPPSYSLAAGLGGGTESLPPRPPARRSFSAPGLPVHSLVDESTSYVTGAQLVANTRLPRHAVGVGVPVDNDSVPPARRQHHPEPRLVLRGVNHGCTVAIRCMAGTGMGGMQAQESRPPRGMRNSDERSFPSHQKERRQASSLMSKQKSPQPRSGAQVPTSLER